MILETLGFLRFTFIDLLDILMVAAILFLIFKWLKGSSAVNIFLAIIFLLVARIVVEALGMKMMSTLLGTIIDVGAIAIIVIFQPEIRRFLNKIGSTVELKGVLGRLFSRRQTEIISNPSVSALAEACFEMSSQKTGALIVIRHRGDLQDIIDTGDVLDASISSRLIMNIFFKNSPLHDGAMIIGENRIIAARCTLPISSRTDLPARFGMRHKAAVGISELSDADVVVVSEQTGGISFVKAGVVTKVDSVNKFKLLLGGNQE